MPGHRRVRMVRAGWAAKVRQLARKDRWCATDNRCEQLGEATIELRQRQADCKIVLGRPIEARAQHAIERHPAFGAGSSEGQSHHDFRRIAGLTKALPVLCGHLHRRC